MNDSFVVMCSSIQHPSILQSIFISSTFPPPTLFLFLSFLPQALSCNMVGLRLAFIHFHLSISQELNPSPSLRQDKDGGIAPTPSRRHGTLWKVQWIRMYSIYSLYYMLWPMYPDITSRNTCVSLLFNIKGVRSSLY